MTNTRCLLHKHEKKRQCACFDAIPCLGFRALYNNRATMGDDQQSKKKADTMTNVIYGPPCSVFTRNPNRSVPICFAYNKAETQKEKITPTKHECSECISRKRHNQ